MTIKEFIGKPVYDPEGQIIMASQKSGHQQMLLDVRGWGAIQNLFKTQKEAMSFQDALGMYITDAINEKLNKADFTAFDLIAAEREKNLIDTIESMMAVVDLIADAMETNQNIVDEIPAVTLGRLLELSKAASKKYKALNLDGKGTGKTFIHSK